MGAGPGEEVHSQTDIFKSATQDRAYARFYPLLFRSKEIQDDSKGLAPASEAGYLKIR
jgi:hypothetical protein